MITGEAGNRQPEDDDGRRDASLNGLRRDATATLGGAGDGHGRLDVGGELLLVLGEGAEVTLDLDAVPEFGGLAEECSEADGHGGRDRAAGVNDLVDGARGDADGAGHGVLGDAHGIEVFFQKNFAGCDGWIHS